MQVMDRKVAPWLYVQLAEEKLIEAKSSPDQDEENMVFEVETSNVDVLLQQNNDGKDDAFTRLEALLKLRCTNNDKIITKLIGNTSGLLGEAKQMVQNRRVKYVF